MSQRSYRRLTRFLFFFLFLVFFLLYLLLSGRPQYSTQTGGGSGWNERHLTLGDIRVSEVRSSGFIVDEFPIPASTRVGDEDFNENVILCSTSVHNEGEVAVEVTVSIHGSKKNDSGIPNPGLCCGFYHYPGQGEDPGEDFAALLGATPWVKTPHGEKNLALYVRDGSTFRLAPGETRHISLFFWVDADEVPTLTNIERDDYSITVKLTSRSTA